MKHNPDKSVAERAFRSVTRGVLEGGGGFVGGLGGAALGSQIGTTGGAFLGGLVAKGPGAAVGGPIGGAIGAIGLGAVGGHYGGKGGEWVADQWFGDIPEPK